MHRIVSLILSVLLVTISVISMEHSNASDTLSELATLPVEASIIVIASCENKNALRQTCKYLCALASRRKNENILVQPQLYLNQEALDRYLLYYGALGNTAIVRNLLARGANPNATEDNGATLMHHAMLRGYHDIANTLLEYSDLIKLDLSNIKRPGFLNEIECNQFGEHLCLGCASKPAKLLHNVVQQGWYEAVEYLLARNVSANATNKKGQSALCCATQEGYIDIMKLLISKGACVNGGSGNQRGPFTLRIAAEKGYTSAVQLLIDYDVDVDRCDKWELHAGVCECGYVQIFKILLAQDANIGKCSTLLHVAAKKGCTQIVKILLENGADANETTYIGGDEYRKPLDVASNEDIKKLLIAYGGKESGLCIIQ